MSKKNQFFSMVEITLALAVIGIGISSILVLFPVGLNMTKSTIANNSIPDAADFLLNYLEITTLENWRHSTSPSNPFLDILPNEKEDDSNKLNQDGSVVWNDISVFDGIIKKHQTHAFIFLFEKSININKDNSPSGKIVEFSAVAQVWKEDLEFYDNVEVISPVSKAEATNFGSTLCLELSWPIERDYESREKAIYKLDVFNPYYSP